MKNFSTKYISGFISILSFLLLSTQLSAQEEVQIKKTDLGSGVYMLTGGGGNIGISTGADGVFMIDDQFAPLSDKIKAAIASVSEQPVKFVINTHWHFDHTGGNENFANSGSVIVAHENVRARMSTDQIMQAFGREVKASPKKALPVLTFTEQVGFHINDDHIQVMHVENAHTDGDAIIYFSQANVLHMGDTFFNGSYPFVDVSAGGSLAGVLAAAKKGIELANAETKIIPGHGPLATRDDLKKYYVMLRDFYTQFKALKAAGQSDEDIMAEGITLDYDEEWGNGFIGAEKFIEILLSEPSLDKQTSDKSSDKARMHNHGAGQKAAKD